MVTESEIEAANRAFHPRETLSGIKAMGWDDYSEGVRHKCRLYMRLALEAAEGVRAHRDAEEIARLTDEKWLAEIVGWALCKHSEGGGLGKCDLMACACGPEGVAVAKAIRAALAPHHLEMLEISTIGVGGDALRDIPPAPCDDAEFGMRDPVALASRPEGKGE